MNSAHSILGPFLNTHKIHVSGNFFDRIRELHDLLVSANQQTNLTRIVDYDDFLCKHIADSLLVQAVIPELADAALPCADVGCGGGFPGLPLVLANPQLAMTEIDSIGKKVAAVAEFQEALGLDHCSAVKGRARELSRLPAFQHQYRIILARAVSDTPKLIKECHRLLCDESGACLVAYKTPGQADDEAAAVRRDAAKVDLLVTRSDCYELPEGAGERTFWILTRR